MAFSRSNEEFVVTTGDGHIEIFTFPGFKKIHQYQVETRKEANDGMDMCIHRDVWGCWEPGRMSHIGMFMHTNRLILVMSTAANSIHSTGMSLAFGHVSCITYAARYVHVACGPVM